MLASSSSIGEGPKPPFEEEVSNILVQMDSRENTRRIEEEKKREARHLKKDREKDESERGTAAIAMKWTALMELPNSVPEILLSEIEKQKQLCDEVLQSKERLLREYKAEIKAKDEEYSKMLTKQAEEIDLIVEHMRRQFKDTKKQYDHEMHDLEQELTEKRRLYRSKQAIDVQELLERKREIEQQMLEWRQERQEDDQRQIEQLRTMEASEFNILKIKLETEVQTLEQQLQEMRAAYQLNNEKLEYNFRLVHERESDHSLQIQQQKKKINRLQDTLSTLKAKYQKMDKKFRQKNFELTEEYKRMTEQYKDLQNKFRHFQTYDHKKYTDVLHMSEERVYDLVKSILQADKVIHEQLLNHNWAPPKEDIFNSRPSSFQTTSSNPSISSTPSTPKPSQATTTTTTTTQSTSTIFQKLEPETQSVFKKIAQLIFSEGSFLFAKSGYFVDLTAPKEEQEIHICENVLNVLAITSVDELNSMVGYFFKKSKQNETGKEMISANEVNQALKMFSQARNNSSIKPAISLQGVSSLLDKQKQQHKEQIQKEQTEYWERISNVISDSGFHVWENLEQEMFKYNKVLNERVKLLDETQSLKQQNEELKVLLNRYLSSKVNEELLVPPLQQNM